MADKNAIAVWITDKIEDDQVQHGVIKDLHDGDGLTRFGLTQKWYGSHVDPSFYTTMGYDAARQVAIQIYVAFFCNPLLVSMLDSNDIAACLVSWAVNNSPINAVKGLQQAVGGLQVDGHIGPATITAVNAAPDQEILAAEFRTQWQEWYRLHSDPRFIDGWIARTNRYFPN